MNNLCYVACLMGIAFFVSASAQWNPCTGRPDGAVLEIRCNEYVTCENETRIVTECVNGTYYDRDAGMCRLPEDGNNACHKDQDESNAECNGRTGTFSDSLNCYTFISCDSGVAGRRMYCPYPLIFNNLGYCDWTFNVDCAGQSVV